MYSEFSYLHRALQKAIHNLKIANLFLWVKSSDGKMLAQYRNFYFNLDDGNAPETSCLSYGRALLCLVSLPLASEWDISRPTLRIY